jgi:hypothetical protein
MDATTAKVTSRAPIRTITLDNLRQGCFTTNYADPLHAHPNRHPLRADSTRVGALSGGHPMIVFWQVFPASGMTSFDDATAAAVWIEKLMASCPTATIIRQS